MIGAYRNQLLLALSLILIFTVLALAACSDNADRTADGNAATKAAATTDAAGSSNGYKDKYNPPVTITTAWGVDPAATFKNGETIENNVATKWAKSELGIEIKSLWSVTDTNNAFATKLRLAMTSGQEMPDVLVVGNNDPQLLADLIDSGNFREVGSLFAQYANDKWKKAMELDSNVWNPYIRGGEKMGIPVLDYAYNNDYLLWIRQDWLDKLGIEAPKTIDELDKVMEAFKNNNPQGLPPEQVIPLSIGFKTSMNTWMGDPSWIFGAYGTIPQQWNAGNNGNLAYGSVHAGIKQGLAKLKEWHEKGYIPQEAALWHENKTAEPAIAGTAGIIPGPYWMSGWPLIDTAKNVKGAVWKPIPLPTGPEGKAGRHGTSFSSAVILISKNMKNPEALFTYQNYMYDHIANPEKGKAPETRLEKELKNNYGAETPAAAKALMGQTDATYMNMFTGPTTTTMRRKMDYLNKIELQTFNEIIYGLKPLDAFDAFVETWKKSGGEQITQEVNEWYDSVK